MEDDTYPALNGMKVTNNRGTFYFSEPGNWIDEDGWPIYEKLHREDGPAAEKADGTKWWYVNGKLHREDGPAIEEAIGSKYWYVDGKLHREDGPAMENANVAKFLVNGVYRTNAPGVENAKGGFDMWYVNGKLLTPEDFNKWREQNG